MADEERCPCGEPLHYSKPAIRDMVKRFVAELGPTQPITVPGVGAWMVPRHYIALHGVKADEWATIARRLGFEEIPRRA
jgi:hypothetical protein